MARLVVIAEGDQNRRLLTERFSAEYAVVAATSADVPADGDVYVIDGRSFGAAREQLRAIRREAEPLLVPMLLLVDPGDVAAAVHELERTIDDLVRKPVPGAILRARVAALARARRLSLELARVTSLYATEREISHRFQAASLPRSLPRAAGAGLTASYAAGREDAQAGGDWYDAFALLDNRLVISVGDVSGAGLEASVTMAQVRQVLRGVAHVNPDPVMMLAAADRMLVGERPDSIVTACVGVYDPVTAQLAFASAGHPRPLACSPGVGLHELVADGLALGIVGTVKREARTFDAPPGSCVVFYSDGLVESRRDGAAGEQRLHAALGDPAIRGADDVARALHRALVPERSSDDVAILVLETRALDPREVLRWRFDALDGERARAARHAFNARLEAFGAVGYDLYKAELVFGEMIGNVVRHAAGEIEIVLDASGASPVLHVLDSGAGFRYIPKLPADVFSDRGRGLYLIAQLTEDFTVVLRRDGGSHARAVLSLAESRPSLVTTTEGFPGL